MYISGIVYCFCIFLLLAYCGIVPVTSEVYEDNNCRLENGTRGECKKLNECPSKRREAESDRKRSNPFFRRRRDNPFLVHAGCGSDESKQTVCCPLSRRAKVTSRANIPKRLADEVCHEIKIGVRVNLEDENVPRILAGTEAVEDEFPYMAALGYNNTDGEVDEPIVYNCGGALISLQFVLTAAHCVINIDKRIPVSIRVGTTNLRAKNSSFQEISVDRIIAHPLYKQSTNYHDIALVQLKKPIEASNSVKPICLQTKPLQASDILPSVSFIVIGFGVTDFASATGSDKLMKTADLKIVPIQQCTSSYQNIRKLPTGLNDKMICAMDKNSTRGSDSCQGDSGGPLLMITDTTATVIGVTSFGQSCGGPVPAVYTSVFSYLDWIEKEVWPDRVNDRDGTVTRWNEDAIIPSTDRSEVPNSMVINEDDMDETNKLSSANDEATYDGAEVSDAMGFNEGNINKAEKLTSISNKGDSLEEYIKETEQLFEGSECPLEDSNTGECKKIYECPSTMKKVLSGLRGNDASDRCGFDGIIEIVCCPLNVIKIRGRHDHHIEARPAETACVQCGDEVKSSRRDRSPETSADEVERVSYVVSLGYKHSDTSIDSIDTTSYDCGGVLISPRFVLTAAHCSVNSKGRVPVLVRLSFVDPRTLSSGSHKIDINRIIVHPLFVRNLHYHDIALVELTKSVIISDILKPICLQTSPLEMNLQSETSFVVTGSGIVDSDSSLPIKLIKSANVSLVPLNKCRKMMKKPPIGLDKTTICAVDKNTPRGSDDCPGDGGDPLLMITTTSIRVIGITTFGRACGGSGPAFYTSIFSHLDWIEKKVWPEKVKEQLIRKLNDRHIHLIMF